MSQDILILTLAGGVVGGVAIVVAAVLRWAEGRLGHVAFLVDVWVGLVVAILGLAGLFMTMPGAGQ